MRVALIGLGAAAQRIHLPALRQLGGLVQVVGGADPDAGARSRATRAGVPEVFSDADRMLHRLAPDLVIVGTPPDRHREDAERGLGAGAHVLLEKPLASSLAEADAIIAAAVEARRRVLVNNQFPWMRIHAAARREIGCPPFGALLHLHAWHTMRPTPETEAGWRGQMNRRLGFEFGIHVLDLVRFFFDESPARIWARAPQAAAGRGEAVNLVLLEWADGRTASLVLNRLGRGPERYLDLWLDGEGATIQTAIGGQAELVLGLEPRRRRPFVEWRLAAGGRAVLHRGERSRVLATEPLNPFAAATAAHLRDGLLAIGEGRPLRTDAARNRGSLALVAALYESAATGDPVDVPAEWRG